MIRALPCNSHATNRPPCGVATLPSSDPYLLARAPTHWPFRYKCASCKRTSTLTAQEWNRLPILTLSELRAVPMGPNRRPIDMSRLLTIDARMTPQQYSTLEQKGVTLHAIMKLLSVRKPWQVLL